MVMPTLKLPALTLAASSGFSWRTSTEDAFSPLGPCPMMVFGPRVDRSKLFTQVSGVWARTLPADNTTAPTAADKARFIFDRDKAFLHGRRAFAAWFRYVLPGGPTRRGLTVS